MRHRHLPLLALLAAAAACQDVPFTPSTPAAQPRFTVMGGATDLRSGYGYLCELRRGTVACFGERDEGQPVGVHKAAAGAFVQLATGSTHACGLRSDGAVECWGTNEFGRAPPLRRAAAGSYTAVSAGLSHSCAVRTDGKVECWGSNAYGQAPPLATPQTGTFTQVTASAAATCALRGDGVVECWGLRDRAPPVRTAPSGTYTRIGEALGNTNCALTTTGLADCWGYQNFWEAGPYVQVTAGAGHQCALRPNGVPRCWGYPGSWEGIEERTEARGGWSRISAGAYHTCGLRTDGYFECFGVQTMGSDAPDVIPAPTVPKSGVRGERIRVQWRDLNSNERRTEIERSVTGHDRGSTSWTRVAELPNDRVVFTDSVAAGATYLYQVRVCNDAGCSPWRESNPTALPVTAPPAPTTVAAAGYTCGFASCARVTWTIDNEFVETFRLQRREDSGGGYGAWKELAAPDRSATRHDDYGLTPGTRYQYRMRSCNMRGCSEFRVSNAVVAPTPPPPAAPASLSAAGMGNYMYVSWGDVADETTYELQRRQQEGTAWGAWGAPIVRTSNVTNNQDAAVPGALYQYRIRACNQGGCSAYTYSAQTRA